MSQRPVTCESCGERRPVMLEMDKGSKTEAWWLCVKCWLTGFHLGSRRPRRKETN